MAIGDTIHPKTLKQLAEDAFLKSRKIGTVTSKLDKVTENGEEIYKCSVHMNVKIVKKDSEIAQRQINHIHKRVKELNNNFANIQIKLDLNKSGIRKIWSYRRFKHKKLMDYVCKFSFSVTNKDIFEVRDASQEMLMHLEELMIVYYKDKYRVKFNHGIRTTSGSSDETVTLEHPSVQDNEKKEETEDVKPSDKEYRIHSNDPQYHIKNESGQVHYKNQSKNHFWTLNCCNTGRKDETGCTTGLFSLLKKCICCSKPN